MLKMNTKLALGTAALLAALTLGYAADEPAGGPPPERGAGGPGGGGGGGGGRDWAAMREKMEEQLKTDLGATDDEWKLIKPRMDKVNESRRNAMMGMMGGMGRGGPGGGGGGGRRGGGEGGGPGGGGPGGGGPGGDRPQPEAAKASEDLRKTLEDKNASADTIKAKVEAVRAAREKAHQETVKAQAELKEILTARQEAVLVSRGMLE